MISDDEGVSLPLCFNGRIHAMAGEYDSVSRKGHQALK